MKDKPAPLSSLRLQPSWHWTKMVDGVILGSITHGQRFHIKGNPLLLERAFTALESNTPKEVPRECSRLIEFLKSKGCLVPHKPKSRNIQGRYTRQIHYLELFEKSTQSAIDLHQKLQNRTVLIVGVGGAGTWVLLNLARMGIKRLIGIDPDRVELSNLSRQVLYHDDDIGDLKVESCARSLKKENPEVKFEGIAQWMNEPNDLIPHLDGVDLVIGCIGYSSDPHHAIVPIAAGLAGVPCLTFGGSWIGPLCVPSQSPCYNCFIRQGNAAAVVEHSFLPMNKQRWPGGYFVPRLAITSSIVAWEAARFLSGMDKPPTMDGVLTLDLQRYEAKLFQPVKKQVDCPICQHWGAGKRESTA